MWELAYEKHFTRNTGLNCIDQGFFPTAHLSSNNNKHNITITTIVYVSAPERRKFDRLAGTTS